MPNIASVLKREISRVARKEVRAELEALKKLTAVQRSKIAELRRQVSALDREFKQFSKALCSHATPVGRRASNNAEDGVRRRFSATRLAKHRAKLELSAATYGQLVGVSGQTIYHWEQGKARPRTAQLQALAAVRGMGKREAEKRLTEVK
ncbi:MAG: helix-turn-helix transcriptional regulator [Pseudacidovorax sp.]|uniref:helix-turn-helix domain-containing protein n=1 Tax=Pseudacidovorax sp. TaxID=1934311 RepID=UPI001B6E2BD9|nr:helix-turn-helix transcriptional regulator [Pseudacidovorax sp.]MBP6895711.1 helix-turn-helix transcriptional regulator [Pseudacidovorax sp.]